MHDKTYYRVRFNSFKRYLKLGCYCDDLNIHRGNLSRFLKSPYYDDCMSLDNLSELDNHISLVLDNLIK